MPWCEDCAKFWNPNTMGRGGECPTCGRVLSAPASAEPRAPWHFKVLVAAVVVYLAFRGWQGVEWISDRL